MMLDFLPSILAHTTPVIIKILPSVAVQVKSNLLRISMLNNWCLSFFFFSLIKWKKNIQFLGKRGYFLKHRFIC